MEAVAKPLDGILVLDFSRFVPGPYCSLRLADLGADVIKVENPILGDAGRYAPPLVDGESIPFRVLNRGKRSLAVNYRSAEGRELAAGLVRRADVLLESFKPGYIDRIGLGYAACRAWNPRLVFCSLSGYGDQGPESDRSGHDVNFLARSGLLDALRGVQHAPAVPGMQLADLAGGLGATVAILAALFAASRTGVGRRVSASIVEGCRGLLPLALAEAALGASPAEAEGYLSGEQPSYRIYRTSDDRYMALGIIEPNIWVELCKSLGREDLVQGQWPATHAERRLRQDEIASIFAGRTQAEWVAFFAGRDVCCEPVVSVREAAEVLRGAPDAPGDESYAGMAGLVRLLRGEGAPPPKLGEHTAEILEWLGVNGDRVSELRAKRIVAAPEDIQPPRHINIF